MAALGLHCCTDFSVVVVSKGYSLVAVHGSLIVVASLVAGHGLWGTWASGVVFLGSRAQAQWLWHTDLVAPQHVGSSWGIDPMSPALAGRFFTTDHQGSPLSSSYKDTSHWI